MKALIDQHSWGAERWVCVATTFPLFLRFLLGSSNQLWYEYVFENPTRKLRNLMLWDFGWLLAFGIAGLSMCYAETVQNFLWRTAIFGGLATLGPLCDTWLKQRKGILMNEFWPEWFRINGIFTLFALAAASLYDSKAGAELVGSTCGINRALIVLAVTSVLVLFFDIYHQLNALDGEGRSRS